MKLFSFKKHLNKVMIRIFGIKISFHLKKTILIENFFKTDFLKKALVVYIMDPFLGYYHVEHSNATEGYIAAQVLSSLGYDVDILDLEEVKNREFYSQYDVAYGKNLDAALFSGTKVIPYSGATAHKNMNRDAIVRAYEFYKKSGLNPINSMRTLENFSLAFSYANVILGNQLVADSFKIDGIDQKLFPIEGFYFDAYDIDIEKKDFNEAKKHFIWWGSTGAIHKGLDLVIEVFRKRSDLILHICGFRTNEPSVSQYYKKELNNEIPNIINHGFVNIKSDLFKEIMDKSCAVVSPSLAEGGAIGIINVLANGGLIPIITKASGLDVGHYGFMFENLDVETIDSMIDKLLKLNENDMKKLSIQVKKESRERYSMEKYKNRLTEILKEILSV